MNQVKLDIVQTNDILAVAIYGTMKNDITW